MIERVDEKTPAEILELFRFPYKYFSGMFGQKHRTVLDAGCGNAINYELMNEKFKKVVLIDKEKFRPDIICCNLLDIPLKDKEVNISFCFEVVEHFDVIAQEILLEQLFRISKEYVVIGSVNKYGPDTYKGVEIFKAKNGKNPYHLNELDVEGFQDLNNSIQANDTIVNYFHSELDEENNLVMVGGLSDKGFCNYAINIL